LNDAAMKVRDPVPEDASALELRAMVRGNQNCTLKSTGTARRFYVAKGYSEDGPADGKFGTISGCPMSKRLTVENLSRS